MAVIGWASTNFKIMIKKLIDESFDVDFPPEVDTFSEHFVGSMYDIYEKGFKSGIGYSDKKVSEFSDKEIEQLASTWAIELNRPITYYRVKLKEVKSGKSKIDSLPYFLVKLIKQMGYDVS
jgi:hypothetical protein